MAFFLDKVKHSRAFTIVELLVVISVIGILSGIGIVSYGAWRNDVNKSQALSDLNGVKAAMEDARNFDSGYPSSLPSSFVASEGITLTYVNGSSAGFCIQAVHERQPAVTYYISSEDSDTPKQGTCPPLPPEPLSAPSISSAVVSGTGATISWGAVTGASRYELSYRGNSDWVTLSPSTSLSRSVTGLAVPASWQFRVRALNAVGQPENISPWSIVVNRVTVPVPVVASYADQGCGNSGGTESYVRIRLNFQPVSTMYTTQYKTTGYSGTVVGGVNNGSTAYVVANTSSWNPTVSSAGTIVIRGVGPDGEESNSTTWTSPVYPVYWC